MDLYTEILSLINSSREGDYWDFKEEPHENKAALLHDIISLANSLHAGKRFLIFGVTDPSPDAKIVVLQPGQKNRKDQSHFIDFLRTKKFAGDIRPEVELKKLIIDHKEIDVLIVFDNPHKPYYLNESYRVLDKVVDAYHIYTRINDTNTPITQSADIGIVEQMWRQRFGLLHSPMERMKLLLAKPEEWSKDIGNKPLAYHKGYPEYTIHLSKVNPFWEPYTLFYTNEKAFLGTASFRYHSTELFELEYMYCDEMRITLPVPDTAYLPLKGQHKWFYYYNLESLSGRFLRFLLNNRFDFSCRGASAPFAVFRNETQVEEFKKQVIKDHAKIESFEPDIWSELAVKKLTGEKQTATDLLFLSKVHQYYDQFIRYTI
jgi:hypothetical protein